jgi:hypothetical protein
MLNIPEAVIIIISEAGSSLATQPTQESASL